MLTTRCTASVVVLLLMTVTPAAADRDNTWDRDELLAERGYKELMNEYRDWPYIYLTKQVELELHRDKTRETTREVLLVTSNEGREQASRKVMLYKDDDFEVRCGTLGLNGSWIPLQNGEPLQKKIGDFVEYTILLEKVVRGSILVFDYERKIDRGMSYTEVLLAAEVPVLHSRVSIEDDDLVWAGTFVRNDRDDLQMTKREEGNRGREGRGRVIYDFHNLEPHWREPMAPSPYLYQPTVVMYWQGRKNWNYMVMAEGNYFFESCNLKDEGDARKLVERIAPRDQDMFTRLSGILKFVRDEFHVIGNPETFRLYPRLARRTFEERMGTVTDVSAVVIGLLRLAEIPFELALVRSSTFGAWHGLAYNASQFTRFVPVLESENERLWIDPLCRECAPGDVRVSFCGTKALVFKADIEDDVEMFVEEARDMWSQSPKDAWERYRYRLHNARWTDIVEVGDAVQWRELPESVERVHARVTPDGELQGTIVLKLTGQPKLEVRERLHELDGVARKEWMARFLKQRHSYCEQVGETRVRGLEPPPGCLAQDDTLEIEVDFRVQDFVAPGEMATLPATMFAPGTDGPLGNAPSRTAPIWMPYSYCSQYETTVWLPANVTTQSAIKDFSVPGTTVRYEATYHADSEKLHCQRTVRTPQAMFSPDHAELMRQEYDQIEAHEDQLVTIILADTDQAKH